MRLLSLTLAIAASVLAVDPGYIVLLRDGVNVDEHLYSLRQEFAASQRTEDNGIIHIYESFNGYAAKMDPNVLSILTNSDDILAIEANKEYSIMDVQSSPPSWGLPRISSRNAFTLNTPYFYNEKAAGQGVDVYVVDTGVRIEHEDFDGRAVWGITVPKGDKDADGQGHGTHVATTIAGNKYGVAKQAKIIAVKVLKDNGSGNLFDVLKGIDWVAKQKETTKRPSVINMSLGGPKSFIINFVVELAVKKGVHVAVAAGNDNKDACQYSPASANGVVSTGASNINDERAFFSNFGECVTLFAPGLNITAGWKDSNTDSKTISGTSMASPHAAGVLALILSEKDMTPAESKEKIVSLATKDKLTKLGDGSPNLLLFNGYQKSISAKKSFTGFKIQRLENNNNVYF
ncbi:hypothetical protein ROZALSC1DRAFT_27585 [Rozella allomycis CSF55]|uniref:Peptidase S8, subtilisin-related domain-containing protein n=1 Tax=Rozella allomycis (strain CSF55) TaxID=988480 RepID=A0A075ANX7_ROZAC|nr:Peptidase S8, subtilisin-related domain-containing protein [Rozella allomycis CSF55]RKP20973.1 hypothetical protein ROZALSC1DRAFT_27585 [Rozella allomycis CSF55]|eukprot:EPZ31599.1 Peptidase S8, subtilisin-related domain-containing protein [Rozella allomycis CSF55]